MTKTAMPFYVPMDNGSGGAAKTVYTHGDFTVRVQRDNFAKYALFTNQQTLPNGTNIWFTNKTNFFGPVHTNGTFNFALNPSGTFESEVVQTNTHARFYNSGSPVLMNAASNRGIDVPTFKDGFTRAASTITLSSAVQKKELKNQARGGDTTGGSGIFVANTNGALTGGIYVNGYADFYMDVSGNNAVYTITQGSTSKVITVNRSANQTTVQTVGGSAQIYNGLPSGMDHLGSIIYVDGQAKIKRATIQADTELTLSTENDIVIENHIRYSNYTPATGTPGTAESLPPSAARASRKPPAAQCCCGLPYRPACATDRDPHCHR